MGRLWRIFQVGKAAEACWWPRRLVQPAAGGFVGDDIYYAGAIVQIIKSAIVEFELLEVCWVWFPGNLCNFLLCKWIISAGLRCRWYLLRCWSGLLKLCARYCWWYLLLYSIIAGILWRANISCNLPSANCGILQLQQNDATRLSWCPI